MSKHIRARAAVDVYSIDVLAAHYKGYGSYSVDMCVWLLNIYGGPLPYGGGWRCTADVYCWLPSRDHKIGRKRTAEHFKVESLQVTRWGSVLAACLHLAQRTAVEQLLIPFVEARLHHTDATLPMAIRAKEYTEDVYRTWGWIATETRPQMRLVNIAGKVQQLKTRDERGERNGEQACDSDAGSQEAEEAAEGQDREEEAG